MGQDRDPKKDAETLWRVFPKSTKKLLKEINNLKKKGGKD